jgi:DnaK suppressor protein
MDKKNLEYFRKILEDLKAETLREIEDDQDIDANENHLPDENDLASVEYEQSFKIRMIERNRKYLKKIDKAIVKIKNGTYGICEECDNDITVERLEARPVATLCIECKIELENEEKSAN